MSRRRFTGTAAVVLSIAIVMAAFAEHPFGKPRMTSDRSNFDAIVDANARLMMEEGRNTFRFDTFGSEDFWGGALGLHDAIQGSAFGGVGSGVSPRQALGLGLKVDADALPKETIRALERGQVDLDDPAVTLALLRQNAVIGVTGFFSGDRLSSIGIQCALCHSSVNNSVAPGVGQRLDGWANRDLNIGAIVAPAPNLAPFATLLGISEDSVRAVLNSWGPGKFDAELILDGKAFRPDGGSAATLIPPAFGLAGVNLHTWTGWGSVTHWNAFVSNLEMHGKGTFFDPRLNDASKFPIAAREGFGNVRNTPDLITAKLPALHFYQLAIPAPAPPEGSFDPVAAARGEMLFDGQARCATCHVEPIYTEPGWNMHTAAEIGIDDFQALRSPDERYRTSPLNGLWTHQKGGFYHDGRFATLVDVVQHYNNLFTLGLDPGQVGDLVEYLKSLPDDQVSEAGDEADQSGRQTPPTRKRAVLHPPSQNPATGPLTLRFGLLEPALVQLDVFDVSGRRIASLVDERLSAGDHAATWSLETATGQRVVPGIYFSRLRVDGTPIEDQRIVLTR